jgi:hypothetical protein
MSNFVTLKKVFLARTVVVTIVIILSVGLVARFLPFAVDIIAHSVIYTR